MLKTTLAVAALMIFASPALAESAIWNVTEEGVSGIKVSQGTWEFKTEGGKMTGVAAMNLNSGSSLSYKIDGSVAGAAYTVNMVDRTDGKKDCVWTGGAATTGKGLSGDVMCDGKKAMIIRASPAN